MANKTINQRIPIFARGSVAALEAAIAEGGALHDLNRIIWTVISEGERQGELAFTTPSLVEGGDPVTVFMKGDNPEYVQVLDELPEEEKATQEVIYIVGKIGYYFNGTEFVKLFDEDRIDTMQAAITLDSEALHDAIDKLGTDLNSLTETVDGLDERITNVENTVEGYNDAIEGIQSSFDDINNELSDHANRVLALENGANLLGSRMDTAEGNITGLNNSVSGIQTDVSDLTRRVTSNETDISSVQSQVTDLGENVTQLSTDVSDAKASVDALDTRTSSLEDDMQEVKEELEMEFIF